MTCEDRRCNRCWPRLRGAYLRASPAEVLGGALAVRARDVLGKARGQEGNVLGGREGAIVGVPGAPLARVGDELVEAADPLLQEVHGLLVEGAAVRHLRQQHVGRPVVLVPGEEVCLHIKRC